MELCFEGDLSVPFCAPQTEEPRKGGSENGQKKPTTAGRYITQTHTQAHVCVSQQWETANMGPNKLLHSNSHSSCTKHQRRLPDLF